MYSSAFVSVSKLLLLVGSKTAKAKVLARVKALCIRDGFFYRPKRKSQSAACSAGMAAFNDKNINGLTSQYECSRVQLKNVVPATVNLVAVLWHRITIGLTPPDDRMKVANECRSVIPTN